MKTLNEYGKNFKLKLIASLLTDLHFLKRIYEILKTEYFEAEVEMWIVDNIYEYLIKFKGLPTLDYFGIKVKDISDDDFISAVGEKLKLIYAHKKATDLIFVKDEALKFCKSKEMKIAIENSVKYLDRGDYDSIRRDVNKALNAGEEVDHGHFYMQKEEIDRRYEEEDRYTIATPWDAVNDLMDGGLGLGELGLIIGGPGIGKTWSLINLGVAAVEAGFDVIHYTLELNDRYISKRYDSIITNVPINDLKYRVDEVKSILNDKRENHGYGQMIVRFYPSRTATVNTIEAHIDNMIDLYSINPKLILIDYADILKIGESEKYYKEIQNVYSTIRGVGGIYGACIWTASQANRSSADDEVIEGDKVSDSYGKIMEPDFVMSLSRKLGDKLTGTLRAHVVKNRFGPDGVTLPGSMNAAKSGRLEINYSDSYKGKKVKQQMKNNSAVERSAISDRIKEMQEDLDNM